MSAFINQSKEEDQSSISRLVPGEQVNFPEIFYVYCYYSSPTVSVIVFLNCVLVSKGYFTKSTYIFDKTYYYNQFFYIH